LAPLVAHDRISGEVTISAVRSETSQKQLLNMIRPISLRIRHTRAIEQAREILVRAGRGEELRRIDTGKVMEEARATVQRRQEQDRLRRVAVLAATKALLAINRVYLAQDQIDADEAERARWHAGRALILDELNK
jgi:hypothetical protein